MTSEALEFLGSLGSCIGTGLANFKIPGTNWSVLGFMLGCLLLSFALRLLFSIFSALNVSGGFSSASKASSSYRGAKERGARRQAANDKQARTEKNFAEWGL